MPESKTSQSESAFSGNLQRLNTYTSPQTGDENDSQMDDQIKEADESDWYGSLREEILKWYVISNDPTERSDEFLQQHIALVEQQR